MALIEYYVISKKVIDQQELGYFHSFHSPSFWYVVNLIQLLKFQNKKLHQLQDHGAWIQKEVFLTLPKQ